MVGDWLRLHRKSLDSRAFSDDWLWRLWCWCLLKAGWKTQWKHGRELLPGQFATGRNLASEQLKVSPSKWYRGMHLLQEWGQIQLEVNNHFTVVTICNWQSYQPAEEEEWTADEQPADNQRTAGEQPVNTPSLLGEEGKKGKKGKKVRSARTFVKPSLEEVAEYCAERGNSIDAGLFMDSYEAKGWRINNVPMKDWRAAVRTWEKRQGDFKGNGKHAAPKDSKRDVESIVDRLTASQPEPDVDSLLEGF